jgi:hypothetical protein
MNIGYFSLPISVALMKVSYHFGIGVLFHG